MKLLQITTAVLGMAVWAQASINPMLARRDQETAPEQLRVRIETLTGEGSVLRYEGRILDVQRSASGLKSGSRIVIRMARPEAPRRIPGQIIATCGTMPTGITPVRGVEYVSYLERQPDGSYAPAAKWLSFVVPSDRS